MPIPYILLENHLTSDPDDYMARVTSLGNVDQTTLIDDMMKRGSSLTRADMVAFLELYYDVIIARLLEGYRVNTPVANLGVSLQGNFKGPEDAYDPTRHLLDPTVSPGPLARTRLRAEGQPLKSEAVVPEPNPSPLPTLALKPKTACSPRAALPN